MTKRTTIEPPVADGPQELEYRLQHEQRCFLKSRKIAQCQRRRAKWAEDRHEATKRKAALLIKKLRCTIAEQNRELGELHLAAGTERRSQRQ